MKKTFAIAAVVISCLGGISQAHAMMGQALLPVKFASFQVSAADAKLAYLGGKVLSSVEVNVVFWGSKVDPETRAKISSFYKAVVVNPYMDWLKEYDTNITSSSGAAGSNQHIGHGKFMGEYTITPGNSALSITDLDVKAELEAQVAAGVLPAPNDNTYYALYFPAGVTISQDSYQSCRDFCAYHNSSSIKATGQNYYYSIQPDFNGACKQGCGVDDVFTDLMIASSHELIETVTDPDVGSAVAIGPPLAWYDQANGEIGDICAYKLAGKISGADGTQYSVQGEWSNVRNACVLAP
jgi:hypothetical protein